MSTSIERMAAMTDEDFLRMEVPSDNPVAEVASDEPVADQSAPVVDEAPVVEPTTTDDQLVAEAPVDASGSSPADKPVTDKDQPVADASTDKAVEPAAQSKDITPVVEVDYKGAYEQLTAPFKANGKTMQVKSVEEAVQLMQMGANYTRKMQELQPHRKTLLMLENNGLLDEGKLSFLIDLDKKNPEAIKKLLKDSNINPLDVDMDKESTYQEGNHKVSDQEAQFRLVLDELNSNPVGRETLQTINSTWDQASKEVLWNQPEVMNTISVQRENGVYARITAEIDRRRTLGQIQVGVPFLEAYRVVGDELHKTGAFNDLFKPKPSAVAPVATRAAMPKPTGVDPKVAAAAVHRGSPIKATAPHSAMQTASDEEFLKMPIPR